MNIFCWFQLESLYVTLYHCARSSDFNSKAYFFNQITLFAFIIPDFGYLAKTRKSFLALTESCLRLHIQIRKFLHSVAVIGKSIFNG